MYDLTIKTTKRTEFIDITQQVVDSVKKSGVGEGLCYIFIPHTTAGVTVNENADPSVREDIIETLERLVPWHGSYCHAEGNAAAHVKASMVGCTQSVLVKNGSLQLGTWQGVFFCEFDGPRTRQVWVEVLPATGAKEESPKASTSRLRSND